jgi:endonuclease/exonuclease/phosphatase family metal-dependent hydrolase
MISKVEGFLRSVRRLFSRSEWAIRLLRLSKLEKPTGEPGLVLIQIDGLSLTQFNRAVKNGRVPFLNSLLSKERYVLHSFYSGLPSNTPAVQGELFYGIKGCIPAFSYMDRKLGRAVKMLDPHYVEQFEPRLKEAAGPGLLADGSAYSNIYTGGAKEAHFCWAKLGWGGVLHATNPIVFPFLILLYIDIFVRALILLVVEFFIALFECIRGTLSGRVFSLELEYVWLRVLVCVFLREVMVAGVCMDIRRGLPIIHLNFLGYDEQSHCRGPASGYAHWALQGIDNAIKRIHNVIHQSSNREYDLWVYGDHGQEKTTPYFIKNGRTIEEAIQDLFGSKVIPVYLENHKPDSVLTRARLAEKRREAASISESFLSEKPKVVVTAIGPVGQIYLDKKLNKEELDFYAYKLVSEVNIPLVLTRQEPDKIVAWTPRGRFILPEQIAEVCGKDHPFLKEIKEDLQCMCFHPDAGDFVIAGWCKDEPTISFPLEYGAHAGLGTEETHSFALLPIDAPLKLQNKAYLRPLDLRKAVQRFLNKEPFSLYVPQSENSLKSLRLMSYNVHGCLGMDGCISTDRIARVIARHNPDIVALQELDVGRMRSKGMDQVERIARKLEMKYHFHPTFRWKDEQYGNAILSQYPLGLIKMAALPQLADKKRYEPRGAMWVWVEFEGTRINIITTHLSIWAQERGTQIDALLGEDWLGNKDCQGPVILCGDFNMMPSSHSYRKVCNRLYDSQTILVGHRPFRTWFGRYPLTQIDYIFVSEEFQVNAISVSRTNLDQLASDHLPLVVDLSFVEKYTNLQTTS